MNQRLRRLLSRPEGAEGEEETGHLSLPREKLHPSGTCRVQSSRQEVCVQDLQKALGKSFIVSIFWKRKLKLSEGRLVHVPWQSLGLNTHPLVPPPWPGDPVANATHPDWSRFMGRKR